MRNINSGKELGETQIGAFYKQEGNNLLKMSINTKEEKPYLISAIIKQIDSKEAINITVCKVEIDEHTIKCLEQTLLLAKYALELKPTKS